MNKKRNIIIVCVAAFAVIAAVIFAAVKLSKPSDVLTQGEISVDMRQGQLQKAKEMPNTIVLVENKDVTFPAKDSPKKVKTAAEKIIKQISNSVFDTVILRTSYLTSKTEQAERDYTKPNEQEISPIFDFAASLGQKKIKVYLQIDISHTAEFVSEIAKNEAVSGIVIVGADGLKANEIGEAMQTLVTAVKKDKPNTKVILLFDSNVKNITEIKKDKAIADSFMLNVPASDDVASFFDTIETIFQGSKVKLDLCFPISKCSSKGLHASWLLEQMLKADGYDFISSRVLDSFSSVKKDFDNCYTAVDTFIRSGVNTSAVFSNLIIEDYDGKPIKTNSYKRSVNIRGAYLYPVTLGKQKIMLSESGKAEVELDLKTGENNFKFSQNGNEVEYKIDVEFEGDIISSVEPADVIYADVKQSVNVKVVAAENAEVTVKLGASKYTVKRGTYEGNGYYSYVAKIKMPNSKLEIDSLGSINVTAVLDGKSQSVNSANIVYSPKSTAKPAISNAVTKQGEESQTLRADNFNDYPTESSIVSPSVSVSAPANIAAFTTAAAISELTRPSVGEYTGNQMCVVTADYADTWPLGNDDKYVPYYTTLARGTMDYVVGESEIYDSEEQANRTFYTLASGRRIQKKSVSLIETPELSDNSIAVLSSAGDNGTLRIHLSTKWKVPYAVNLLPQEYYSSKGRLFNVREFTASYVQFVFYHTTGVTGQVDVSGSNVVSSASWSVDSAQKAVVLTMPLKAQGCYYGYSLEYDSGGNIILTVHNKPQALTGSVVLLDPGHGGRDPGAPGYANLIKESDVNFAVAALVKSELESHGATVYMTRYDDKYMTLEERKAFARAVKPDVFVSIHSNASEDKSAYGTAVYYYRPMSQPLSQSIYANLVSAFKNYLYPNDSVRQAGVEKGSNYNPFSVARLEECPSVLIEMGFITNEIECQKLADEGCRQNIATAIATGIESYLMS